MTDAHRDGFCKMARHFGADPDELQKEAQLLRVLPQAFKAMRMAGAAERAGMPPIKALARKGLDTGFVDNVRALLGRGRMAGTLTKARRGLDQTAQDYYATVGKAFRSGQPGVHGVSFGEGATRYRGFAPVMERLNGLPSPDQARIMAENYQATAHVPRFALGPRPVKDLRQMGFDRLNHRLLEAGKPTIPRP